MVIPFINTTTYIIAILITTIKGFLHHPQNKLTILTRKESFGNALLIEKLEKPNIIRINSIKLKLL